MNVRPSICFLSACFGQWPFWFHFSLESCRSNSDIHWISYTDCGIPDDFPANVRIVNPSFSEYCGFVAGYLKIDFHPISPYKLCDLKPALGCLHRSDLKDLDFLAFGNIGHIYSDLRSYFTESFKSAKDWKPLLNSRKHQWVDKSTFSQMFVRQKNRPRPLTLSQRWRVARDGFAALP